MFWRTATAFCLLVQDRCAFYDVRFTLKANLVDARAKMTRRENRKSTTILTHLVDYGEKRREKSLLI
jgi:hypothetical protein